MNHSIGTLNATLRADAVQFLNELDRAERAVKSHGTGMEQSINHTIQHIEKQFSAARFAHGFLASFGIGTGAAVVEHAFEGIKGYFEEIEKHSEETRKRWVEISKLMEEAGRAGASKTDNRALITHDFEDAKSEVDRLAAYKEKVEAEVRAKIKASEYHDAKGGGQTYTEAEIERMSEQLPQMQEAVKMYQDALEQKAKAEKVYLEAKKQWDAEAAKSNDLYSESAEYVSKLADEQLKKALEKKRALEEITRQSVAGWKAMSENELKRIEEMPGLTRKELQEKRDAMEDAFWAGKISADQAAEAIGNLDDKIKQLDAKDLKKSWEELGHAMASSLAQAIEKGESLGQLLRGLAQDIEHYILQKLIVESIGNTITSGLSSLFGGHAGGGNMDGPGWVGEHGPELFVPSTSGMVIPHSASMAMAGSGGSAGNTFNIDARGADPAQIESLKLMLRSLNASIESRAIAANLGYQNRTPAGYRPGP